MERFRPFDFQPRRPRFRNLMRKNPSDALATPFRSIARHPYPSIGPTIPVSVLRYPYLLPSGSTASKFRNPESGVLKNCRRARGVLKRPRSVSAMLFLTPF